jgi:hypothetical protein
VDDLKPLPEGIYAVQIKAVHERKTHCGDPSLRLRLVVLEGLYEGRSVWTDLPLSPEARPRLKCFLAAIGLQGTGKVQLTSELLEGRSLRVTGGSGIR